ncbi:MAG TPA: energy-coupling factor ABC transporter permease [Candidatus Paceibacterota bacterium]|nr:energy-coupling factor ABC transporter permease [Verrucomicrobiota bacterium]HSA08782.1 energy-coupling factor ABC transporter permease [Candidatus Paceibacterota bacterium]
MHIPDGFIDGKTAVATIALSAAGVGIALRQVRRRLPARRVPLLGLAAAFLFAAQMVNFPVAAGTSGHLVGGVLAAALLGPGAAITVLTTVLIVQCFLFADGGVLALGANIFNMAIVGVAGGYGIYWLVCRWLAGTRGQVAAVAFAGWCSTVLASVSCAGQLAWSGTVPWAAAFTAMTSVHMVIGIGEGLISALVLLAIQRVRPDLTDDRSGAEPQRSWGELGFYGLLATLGVAVFVAPFACPWPDGLEAAAAKLGIEHKAVAPLVSAPAADYQLPGVQWAAGATALAGVVGAAVVFVLALLLARSLVRDQEGRAPVAKP